MALGFRQKKSLGDSRLPLTLIRPTKNTMAAVTYAYQAFYSGYATPTQLYYVDFADKALAEIDRIRDLADPANRRKLRVLAEAMCRNYMDEDLDQYVVGCYVNDTEESHKTLFDVVESLVTPPDPW